MIEPDPEYDFVKPASKQLPKRGRQCGQCGMKFDYGTGYGYHCSNIACPMGWGSGGAWVTGEEPG